MERNWFTRDLFTQKLFTPDRLFLFGLILAAIVYSPTLQNDFVFDDVNLILLNDSLGSWSKWPVAFTEHVWAFHQPPAGARHYRPAFVLWLLANKQLFGDIAPWWHLTSLLLHLVATTLVYRLAVRLLKDAWPAAVAAVIFAVHPVHIESVAWISASTDLLATVFLLASFLCYLNYREPPDPTQISRSWLFAALASSAAAILSKETAAAFPVVIYSYELLSKHSALASLARALPFAGVVALYFAARRLALPIPAPSSTDADTFTILTSLPLVAAQYAKTLAWPFQLSFFYDPAAASQWTLAAAALVLLAIVTLIFLLRLSCSLPEARLPLAWLLIFAAPPLAAIAVFTRDNWVHDRHMYLPSVGFCLLAALLLMRVSRWRTLAAAAATAVLTVALALQLPRFANELTLYEHAMQRSPHNIEMRLAYADALHLHGRPAESQQEYERIVKLAPDSAAAFTYLGMNYDDAGHTQRAQAALARAVALSAPGSYLRMTALFRLGSVELKLGGLAAAEAHLRGALQLNPQGWNYHATLAEVLRRQGRTAEAERELQLEAAARQASIARRVRSK